MHSHSSTFARFAGTVWLCVTLGLCAGCGSAADSGNDAGAASACLASVYLDCQPLYQPTFDNIFDNRIGVTCGAASTGRSCHSNEGAMGGLVMADKETAYAALLGEGGGKKRVVAGDPECSLLARRIESSDPDFVMPPGSPLSDAERRAILLWIANGAQR